MKAFKIGWPDKHSMSLHLSCRYQLPWVRCNICFPKEEAWGDGMFEYPAFNFDFLRTKGFSCERSVELSEFKQLKLQIEQVVGRSVNLIPGGSIGELTGTADKSKLNDFEWGTIFHPQISKRARDIFAADGIELFTAECNIRFRGKKIDSHLAIQIEPVALLTQQSLEEQGITWCSRCGNFLSPRSRREAAPSTRGMPYRIRRASWPKGQHLVAMEETHRVLASVEFIEAVKKHKLNGIKFEECGKFV